VLLLGRIFSPLHVGESLLPYNREIFESMGVLPALEAAHFTAKSGAQFHLGNGSKSLSLLFREGRFTREPAALQVERATFDHLLLKHARASGAEIREGWKVTKASSTKEFAEVTASGPGGQTGCFRGAFLIDASGRGNITGNQAGCARCIRD